MTVDEMVKRLREVYSRSVDGELAWVKEVADTLEEMNHRMESLDK